MKKFCTLLTIAVAMLVSSCLQYDREEGIRLTKALKVTVSVDDMETAGTKSAVTAQDVSAENFNIWVYDDKGLVYDGYFTDADNIKVDKLTVGTTYYVRAVANVGAMSPPATLAAADALFFDWDISGLNSSAGVPMTYKNSFTLAITSALDIHFRRTVAKYTFVIDQSGFTGTYTIKSLRLCNAPSKVLAFAESKIDGTTITATDGDYATDADLTKLNQGLGVQFFIYENNQGELLSGNTDPWKKEFENYNTGKASYASKCTYLEVTGNYVTSGITVEDLTYRIYLGKNATTNFDVTRNTAYTVILAPQDAAVLDDGLTSWKVEKGEITDTRGLSFCPASIEVPSMGQSTATVVPTPAALEYVLEAGDNFTAAGLTFEQAGNSVTVRSGSIVSVETSAKLIARTADGSLSKALPVTVLPPTVESVTVSPADGWEIAIGEDKQFTATATMFDGTSQDVTSSVTWTTTSTLTKEATAGLFSGKAAGSAAVKAEYEGKTAISTGTVKEDVYSYRIVLSGSSVAVSAGKTAEVTPKVMYYATKNGVEDSGTDVTASVVFKSKNTGIATVSGTTVTGVSVGNTKLYAEYSNGNQTISSDKVSGGSYIDVTVSDKSVDGYEYNDPILELSYSDVGAGGSDATPTLTYSQTATRIWSDGSTEENVVIAAAGSSIPSGVTVTWGGSAKNGSGGSINSSNGNVTAKNRGINDYSRGVVFTATASATINGKPGSTSKDVYQAMNEIVSTVQADSRTENSDWRVSFYQETGFSDVASSGGTPSFKTCAYHTAKVYKKYTRTWTSGSSATSDWEYASSSEPYDNVTISSNQSWARVSTSSTGGDFNKVTVTVDANSGAARNATITIRNSNGNTSTKTISQKADIYVESYGTPTVTLSYPGPIAYNSASSVSPTLTVKQVYNYSDGTSPEVTLSSSDYTVSYSGSASGFTLSSTSGTITPSSNAGNTTPGGTTYGEIENLNFTYPDIAVEGGTSNPNISYTQSKTVTTDNRTSTSSRSIKVTANVMAHGKSNSDSKTVTQNGDSGQTSTTTTTTVTSGATITYSVVSGSSALSVTSGKVSAGSNAGSGGGTTYSDPVVTFSPSTTAFPLEGATYTLSGVSFTQTETLKGRSSTDSRSKTVKASLSLNGKTADKQATCTQAGDSGTSDVVSTITSGGSVSYSASSVTGFTLSSYNKTLKADSNAGTATTVYSDVTVSAFSYPDVPAAGGTAMPTGLSYSQTKTESRTSTSSRSITVTATVSSHSKSGTATATFTQPGDPGVSGETTDVTSFTVLYSASYKSGFTLNSKTTGEVKWDSYTGTTSDRTADVKATVTGGGSKSGSNTATSKQMKKNNDQYDIEVD